MKLRALFLLVFIGCINSGFSQSYSNDREKFVKEFQKVLSEYGKGDYQDFAKKELPVMLLEGSSFPNDYFSKMIETCNQMDVKRLKPYPEIYNYVFSVASFVKGKQPKESYLAWHDGVDKMLDNRNIKKFEDFIELSAGFFSESRISESPNYAWFYDGGTYNFEFDAKTSISFAGGNLICRAMSRSGSTKGEVIDSLSIINTTGEYDPMLKKWQGTGGKITWAKVGLPSDKTFAVLKGYETSMRNSTINVDTVDLTTPYFSKPIKGMLADRAFKINREEDKIFPQFLSFEKRLLINSIVPDVDYTGGFSMQGSSFVGAGTSEKPAMITYKKGGVPFIIARSKLIYVSPKKITTDNANIVMLIGPNDSISHSSASFLYDLTKKNIEIVRGKTGGGDAPFQDSYHQLDIFVPKIAWEVGSENIFFTFDFGTSQQQKLGSFESKSYFNAEVYDRLQGMSSVHPLVALFRYAFKYDEMTMTAGKASSALGQTLEQAKGTLLELSSAGFISYDSEGGIVAINQKLITFVKAKTGELDYDNIVFKCDFRPKELGEYTADQIKESQYLQSLQKIYADQNELRRIKKEFGILNLTTMDLDLEAVDNIVISAARNFIVFPENSQVKVKSNRDFNFTGWVNAGKMELNTKAAKFKYDEYKVEILSTNESLFRVRPLTKEDGINSIPMISTIAGISGEILIDDPTNRSGNKKGFEKYPYLKSTTASKVFYNSKDVFRGVYDSTRFYYTIAPFEMDSLNAFKEGSLRLKGELTSAGIFPKIKESLKIMPDYSFGFGFQAPAGGYDFYGPTAKYENKIVLSHNGLQGTGTINFVHSSAISKALTFLPDSTIGYAQFSNKGIKTGIEFPDVQSEEAFITYIPKGKMLKAKSTPLKPLNFFDGKAKMQGTAYIREEGMTGSGMMNFITATLISDIFEYKNQDIFSDTASFSLRNEDTDVSEAPLAFKTDDVNVHVDFKERKGEFNSNKGESVVEFPVNEYKCKMDKFTWWMDNFNIDMERQKDRDLAIEAGVDLKGANFFSLNSKQDSLEFRAPRAKFDTKNKVIHCQNVDYLDIADARIYPDSMELYIRKKAKMDPLKNSKIVANYITKYHQFENATVQVLARRNYEANADYAYYDQDSLKSLIPMKSISLDTSYQTIAAGVIDAEYGFKLSEHFDFYGNFSIAASKPSVLFDGATRINHNCEKFDRNWMSFKTEVDPTNIQIPVSQKMKDLNGAPISAGIVWRDSPIVDSLVMYPTFLSALTLANDPIVITASGFLQYNDISKEYQIGSKEKLVNRGEKGNYLALHTESCSLSGDGVINLGMNYGESKMDAVGVVNYNQTTGMTSMNVSLRYTAEIDKSIFQNAAKRMQEVEGLQPMAFNSSTLEQAIVEWDSREAAEETKSKYTIEGAIKKVPNGLNKSLVFTGVRLESYSDNMNNRGLISSVESAVIVNFFGEPVMKYVPFKAFFQQIYGDESDQFSIMTDIPGNFNYFFHYEMAKKDGTLRVITNDTEFNTEIAAIKEDKLKSKNFRYESSSQTVYMNKLLELFNK
jgi:hypothetical protein